MAEPESERYVAARELAQLMGVSERTIKRMTAAGMPSENWGMSRCRRYRASEAMAWARAEGTINPESNPLVAARQRRDEQDQCEDAHHG
jgi:phage terminase Nu1 subunit (DNA packaging protein)